MEELSEPLHVLEEAFVVDGLVVNEFEDVEESHKVTVNDGEDVRLYEVNFALAGVSEKDKIALGVAILLYEDSLLDHELN